jgi:hypothetical protein
MNDDEYTTLIRACAAEQASKLMDLSASICDLQETYPESTPEFRHLGNARSSIKLAAYVLHARGGRNGR